MRPTWLFEADVFGETAEPLKAEVRRQGMACFVTRQQLLAANASFAAGQRLPDDACVIACGSFPFVDYVRRNRRWLPGGWCSAENLDCAAYYPHFAPFLLNARHALRTAAEALAQQESLFAEFGRGRRVFVRPSGCQKLFAGRPVCDTAFAQAIAPARYDPTTRIVVAEPKSISREWRLVVAEGKVIAASQYWKEGALAIAAGCPAEVRAFVEEVLAQVPWRPDPIFTVDVCESERRLFVVELGGFSCSGLYRCDPTAVVAGASELATKECSPPTAS